MPVQTAWQGRGDTPSVGSNIGADLTCKIIPTMM
jgi:hypothetical protein